MTGTGTVADPYIIYTPTDLQNVSLDLTAYYELGCNIDAAETVGWNAGAGFVPIGDNITPFQGHFNGRGYTVSNLFINRPATDDVGLFGYAEADDTYTSVTVEDFTLADVDITGDDRVGGAIGSIGDDTDDIVTISQVHTSGNVAGDENVGGMIGEVLTNFDSGSTISDSSSSCTVAGIVGSDNVGGFAGAIAYSLVTRCYATGVVTGEDTIGGFAGYISNYCTVTKCCATGAVTATDDYAGGFAGYIGLADVSDCYARGAATGDASLDGTSDKVGGFTGGMSDNSITNCFSTGVPTGTTNVGGFVGRDWTGEYSNCFWDTTTSGTATACGSGAVVGVTGEATEDMQDITTFSEADWDISRTWSISASCNGGYPCLVYVNSCCPTGISPPAGPTVAPKKVSLELIRNLEIMNGGRFFIDKSGNARWESRYHRG